MRAAKILAAVALAVALGTTPSSSWNLPAKGEVARPCLPRSAIWLSNSSGAAGIALISTNRCSR